MPRQKAFDPDQALDKAMAVFWQQGYAETSIQDLVDSMGINRFSIYDTFGDKERLFHAALERYQKTVTGELMATLSRAEQGLDALEAYFALLKQALHGPIGRDGCFFINTVVERINLEPEMTESLRQSYDSFHDLFYNALLAAKERGQLKHPGAPRTLARHLVAQVHGTVVMAKATRDTTAAADNIDFVIEELQSWR